MFYLRCLCCPNSDQTGYYEFEIPHTDPARCPKCESTLESGRIEQMALVHLEPPYSEELRGRRGSGKIACTGESARAGSEYRLVTGSPRAVNCPECLQTEEYAREARAVQWTPSSEQRARIARAIERKARADAEFAAAAAELAKLPTEPEPHTAAAAVPAQPKG